MSFEEEFDKIFKRPKEENSEEDQSYPEED